jgi:predicted glycoside hydrolase/deacetylase ChbG (UPF0249 family)
VKKQLIVTADDFGMTRGVNEGIVAAHRSGVVTCASLMVNGGAFDCAVEMARQNPDLDLGLHLNLTHRPLRLLVALAKREIEVVQLEREIRVQIEKALATGLPISHLDGHKHVHAIPQVLKILRRVLPEYGIRAIRPLKAKTPKLLALLLRNPRWRIPILKQHSLGKCASLAWKASWRGKIRNTVKGPQRFYGIAETGFLDLPAFADIIRSLAPGVSEVMCHPGYVDEEMCKLPTRLRAQRERELDVLTSTQLRNLITSEDVHLTNYRQMGGVVDAVTK